jgi:ribosomal peptide maturation radical SAM protein 1
LVVVAAPFLDPSIPSIQLAALSSALAAEGIRFAPRHLYIELAAAMSPETWTSIRALSDPDLLYLPSLYPARFAKTRTKVTEFFRRQGVGENVLDRTLREIAEFNCRLAQSRLWTSALVIAFSVSYYQLAASLYFARLAKTKSPDCVIVFGGSNTAGSMGRGLLESFPFVDYVLAGYSDQALPALLRALLTKDCELESVDGLLYRSNNDIRVNDPAPAIAMDELGCPDYAPYFSEVKRIGPQTLRDDGSRDGFELYLENARGCYWRKCTFCSALMEPPAYQETDPERLVSHMVDLNDKFNVTRFRLTGETYSRRRTLGLARALLDRGTTNFDIMLYARCGYSREEYQLLRHCGIRRLMIGIEQFSAELLRKMRKGTTPIQNVFAISAAAEAGIAVTYNVFVSYPAFTRTVFDETVSAIERIKHLPPPYAPQLFELQQGSPIFEDLDAWEISSISEPASFQLLFPDRIRESLQPFRFEYVDGTPEDFTEHLFKLIIEWIEDWRSGGSSLTFNDNFETLLINRTVKGHTETLSRTGLARELCLFCREIRSREEIEDRFTADSDVVLELLAEGTEQKLFFRDDGKFFFLPLAENDYV